MDSQKETWFVREEHGATTYEIGSPDLSYPDVIARITPNANGYEVEVERVHVGQEYDEEADDYDYVVDYEPLHSSKVASIGEVSEIVYGRYQIDLPKDLSYQLLNRHGELEREARRIADLDRPYTSVEWSRGLEERKQLINQSAADREHWEQVRYDLAVGQMEQEGITREERQFQEEMTADHLQVVIAVEPRTAATAEADTRLFRQEISIHTDREFRHQLQEASYSVGREPGRDGRLIFDIEPDTFKEQIAPHLNHSDVIKHKYVPITPRTADDHPAFSGSDDSDCGHSIGRRR